MSNFLDLYVDFCCGLTDAPKRFHEFMGYALLGVLLGREVYFPFGGNVIYPNFYMALIAPSSVFRKSTALTLAAKVIRNISPERILPAEFSQEALLETLSFNTSGTFIFYEFKSLLGQLEKDYMQGAKAFLTEIFDCPDYYRRKTKSADILIEKPCVSLLAATTMEWFTDRVRSGDFEGGFLNRFLFVPVSKKEKSMAIPPKLDEAIFTRLTTIVRDLLTFMKNKEITLSGDARETYINWYNASSTYIEYQKDDSRFCASATRMQVYLIKFAMLVAIIDNRATIIGEDHMLKAISLVDWLTKQTEHLIKTEVHSSKFEKQMKSVMRHLEREGGVSNWSRLLYRSNLKTKELQEVIQTLEERGELSREVEKEKGAGCQIKLTKGVL